jgi:hypothetical protein
MSTDTSAAASSRSNAQGAGAPVKIELTPAMVDAGESALGGCYLDLVDGTEYRQIVRIVHEAMEAVRLGRVPIARRTRPSGF